MGEAIRNSGEVGRRRVEGNELRRQRKEELKEGLARDAAAEGEHEDPEGGGGSSSAQIHRFDDMEEAEEAEQGAIPHGLEASGSGQNQNFDLEKKEVNC